MSHKKRKRHKNSDGDDGGKASPHEPVSVSGWSYKKTKVTWKKFPGPQNVDEPVRLCMSREAYASLISHAKEFLDNEVCGVLIGEFCEDDEGEYVAVLAIIPGEAAREDGTHVTFTQETWNRIHECRDERYPNREIVGWYHTHPGFGVKFSEMDLFIQRNFFSGPNQIAFVTDPLGGEEAICANTPDGIKHASRFWVEGRERRCQLPGENRGAADNDAPWSSSEFTKALSSVENRLNQVVQAVDDQRVALYRFLLVLGMVVALVIVAWIGLYIYNSFIEARRPPETVNWAPVPVQVGDEMYLFGVQTVRWRVPKKMEQMFEEAVIRKLMAEEKARMKKKAEQDKKSTSQPGS